ncbi:phage tail tape measure protein [Pseudarthrobacter sp902506025]|uniref:phage tail tape measure protein n=1 Tax=Pseudarthrobacter sp. 902506025 TaxID=3155291 RepID=UPI00344CF7B4
MANKINIVISAEDKASKPIRDVTNELDQGTGKANKFSGALGSMGAVLAKTALAVGAAGVAAGTFAVSSAANYEQSLNVFRSVSGATVEQMNAVASASRALGNDMSLPGVSAKDAALAMVELAKAGLSVNDTMAASKGVLSLAKAGQMETADAAEVAANALNSFGLAGSEAGRVADLLAAAANASSADVKDMAYSLQMSSASAAAVKVPVEDLTTMIGEMANNGIKGSDAGTSLKTMFMNLIPTTDNARAAMKKLNLDFYDAKGNFVGVREAINQLEKGTKNLTDEQKALAIQTIFGSDSSRAANILIKEGVAGYDQMSAAVNKQGAAADLAAAQNAGFKGAIDGLQSSLETVAIDVGMQLLPSLTSLATYLAKNVEPTFNRVKNVVVGVGKQVWDFLQPGVMSLGDAIGNHLLPAVMGFLRSDFARFLGTTLVAAVRVAMAVLDAGIRVVTTLFQAFSGGAPILIAATVAFVAYNVTMGAVTLGTKALAAAQLALNAIMSLNPYVLVAAAIGGLLVAFASIVTSSGTVRKSTEDLVAAHYNLKQATDNVKNSEQALTDSRLAAEGSRIAVERAEERLAQLRSSGKASALDLKEAEFNLQSSKENSKRASEDLAKKEAENAAKREEQAKKKEALAKSEAAFRADFEKTSQAVSNQKNDWIGINNIVGNLNGKKFGFELNMKSNVSPSDIQSAINAGYKSGAPFKHATGTTYAPGGRTRVGEHGAEDVIMPQGAQVVPAYRTRAQVSSGAGGNTTLYVGQINNYTETDNKVFLTDIGLMLRAYS